MFKIDFNGWLETNLLTVKEVSEKADIHEQTLYRIKRDGNIRVTTARKMIAAYPNFKEHLKTDGESENN